MTSISIPLDSDGFMRRKCPACEQQFKWRVSGPDDEAEHVDQYFCPLCGRPAGLDAWWTHEQLQHAETAIVPEALRTVQDALGQAFKGTRSLSFKPSTDLGDVPVPEPLHEPDDMVIVEPPCHSTEPVKIADDAPGPYYCLVCGSHFAA